MDMPPASAAQEISPNPERGLDLSLLLGTEYERKKNKLQQELQLDYKHYVAHKNDLKTREAGLQPQCLSLPIDEKVEVQEKLREERKKEYNLFLQQQAQTRGSKRATHTIPLEPVQVQASNAVCISAPASLPPILNSHTDIKPAPRERPASRRDAATLTEAVEDAKERRTRRPGHQGRRRWRMPEKPFSSDKEQTTDGEEELEFRPRRRRNRHTPEPEYKVERRTRERKANRAPQDVKEVEAAGVRDQNNNEYVWSEQLPESMGTPARSTPAPSKDKAEFTTGLMIGAADEQTVSQMKKNQYKEELLKQIAEQQRNKIREKTLELGVAATGATDPEKEPNRIKQFGAVNRNYDGWKRDVPHKPGKDPVAVGKDPNPPPKNDKPFEGTEQRGPQGRSHVDPSTALSQLTGSGARAAQGVPSLHHFSEDYHRELSNVLAEVVMPRVAGVLPPIPPTVTNNYKTPYDAAYYYYGTRNPLDPNLNNQNGPPEGLQQSGNFHSPRQRLPPLRPDGHTETADQHRSSPLTFGEFPADMTKQRREGALSYQEALKEQIKEREERKRREKKEKERYDAKIEAEMMAYNPWGKSGGGAPIIDRNGNLVTDLKQRRRTSEESRSNSEQTQSFLMTNGNTAGDGARAPGSHRPSGFNDPAAQQLIRKDKYKEDLRQQIQENRRKQEEERELRRAEEEKEEKRLADQRARIQREYEEEQRRQNEHKPRKQSWSHDTPTQQKKEEKRVRREPEIEKTVPESAREQRREWPTYEREPSPPIPTLRRKQTILVASRPSSTASQLSSRTERSVSAPHYRPVPPKMPQQQDGQQEVIRELSALRGYLRKEQRKLEAQLGQTSRQESPLHHTPPDRPGERRRAEAHKQPVRPSTRSPSSGPPHVNMQNIREFNQLKYRDTESREEVRHMYPDPPTDAQSLDIQQQALLREQQRRIRLMRREEEPDLLDHQLSRYRPRNGAGRSIHRDSILPSETAFIDVYGGDACEEPVRQQRPPPSPEERREKTAPRRRHGDDEAAASSDQRSRDVQPGAESVQSVTALNLESEVTADDQHRTKTQDTDDHNSRSEGLPGDEVDALSLRSALERRVSVETVATEPWLRPGTSDAAKRSGCRETPRGGRDAPPWLTHRVT